MDLTILCSSKDHPVYPHILKWATTNSKKHNITVVNKSKDVLKGEILFLISCTEMIKKNIRDNFKHTLVIHESDVPYGRGWSPLIWQILENKNDITISLIEAIDKVDTGNIWKKEIMHIENHEMVEEINKKLFSIKLKLVDFAIKNINKIQSVPQNNIEGSYYSQRTPDDSKLDINDSIENQFNLLRIVDKIRYPCYFEHLGHKYKIIMEKIE